MAIANDTQVQGYVDNVLRPLCELLRKTVATINDAVARIDDVYANVTQQSPTFTDSNATRLPHSVTPADILAVNELMHTTLTAITGDANYAVALRCCTNTGLQ